MTHILDIVMGVVIMGAFLSLMTVPFLLRDSKEERRVKKLRLKLEEAKLRNDLLKLEGRESEIRKWIN